MVMKHALAEVQQCAQPAVHRPTISLQRLFHAAANDGFLEYLFVGDQVEAADARDRHAGDHPLHLFISTQRLLHLKKVGGHAVLGPLQHNSVCGFKDKDERLQLAAPAPLHRRRAATAGGCLLVSVHPLDEAFQSLGAVALALFRRVEQRIRQHWRSGARSSRDRIANLSQHCVQQAVALRLGQFDIQQRHVVQKPRCLQLRHQTRCIFMQGLRQRDRALLSLPLHSSPQPPPRLFI
mmetsp:Transcript_39780/g.71410  ORF Transcript_39780/g.71410 Transcript_39780/m.71410 type:complete len:237 (-) Transcript_39780:126-836(-)